MSGSFAAHWAARQYRCRTLICPFSVRWRLQPESPKSPPGAGSFNPFDSFDDFLVGGFIFEDVGVTAYSGAAGLISRSRRRRRLSHGGLRHPGGRSLPCRLYPNVDHRASHSRRLGNCYPQITAANLVEDLRATLTVGDSAAPSTSGSVETLLTLPTNLNTPSAIVAANPTTAVGFARTVNQVLHIVYGSRNSRRQQAVASSRTVPTASLRKQQRDPNPESKGR